TYDHRRHRVIRIGHGAIVREYAWGRDLKRPAETVGNLKDIICRCIYRLADGDVDRRAGLASFFINNGVSERIRTDKPRIRSVVDGPRCGWIYESSAMASWPETAELDRVAIRVAVVGEDIDHCRLAGEDACGVVDSHWRRLDLACLRDENGQVAERSSAIQTY